MHSNGFLHIMLDFSNKPNKLKVQKQHTPGLSISLKRQNKYIALSSVILMPIQTRTLPTKCLSEYFAFPLLFKFYSLINTAGFSSVPAIIHEDKALVGAFLNQLRYLMCPTW
ncbi:Nurim [Platysternon megacephalum]|uniref:Nurim n=1 Tax=Platysternon megacephalum TaxID=55544 RepID=A0A4D9DQ28_9SAUR|nr:Nurim [Platysternon megacephalum]